MLLSQTAEYALRAMAWLATVPLKEVSVEPARLRPVYEQVHPKK